MESARPLASTSATAIWTEAWSLEVMRRSKKTCGGQFFCLQGSTMCLETHWSPHTCGGRKGRRGLPKNRRFRSKFVQYIAIALNAYLIVLHGGY